MQKARHIKGKERGRLVNRLDYIDYKDVDLLKTFVDIYGRIVPRRYLGVPVKKQKELARAIKRSRVMGLLQFVK